VCVCVCVVVQHVVANDGTSHTHTHTHLLFHTYTLWQNCFQVAVKFKSLFVVVEFNNDEQSRLTLDPKSRYGVATISRLLKITGLFCKRAL